MKEDSFKKKKKIAVLGATGYTGTELIRLLINHPGIEIVFASSESYSGKELAEVHPQFTGLSNLILEPLDVASIPADTDMVFCALPHGSSAKVVPQILKRGLRLIDLSADFRLKNKSLYPLWYDREHEDEDLLIKAVYGLPEIREKEIAEAALLANPGCYPTGILLALAPLAKKGLLNKEGIIIDAKSGITGGGRAPRQPFHYPECNDSFKAYRVASHQHTPEIEQELSFMGEDKSDIRVTFIPHLVPMSRGILATVYVDLKRDINEAELCEMYSLFYKNKPFVQVLKPPLLPETRWVKGTNNCHLAVRKDKRTGKVIIISAIDNLVKGASGQAIQNMNIMFGWAEDTGLRYAGLAP